MGQTLSSPATEKHSESGGDERFLYGLSEMQGWRISMEDSHATVLNLQDHVEDPDSAPRSGDINTFFAVYDGHGGSNIAKYSGAHLHKRLVKEDSYAEKQWAQSLKRAFLGVDEDIRSDPTFFRDPSGCTAVAALITHDRKVFVANAGDSRSVMSIKGEVKPLSFDHKPLNESEMTRIRNAGGYVEYGRVNGNLALSRAIGDFEFKKDFSLTPEEQIITADPEITEHQLTDEDEFLVLACDGIWDCLSSQQVVDTVRLQVSQGKELSEICEFLCDLCLAPDTTSGAGVGCDNMTVLIVAILNGRTKDEWYRWIADRVEKQYGYATPLEPPQIYAASRLQAYRVRRQQYEERMQRDRENGNDGSNNNIPWRASSSAFGLARSMLGGGISFHPASGMSDDGTLMLSADDSDDDSGDDALMDGDDPEDVDVDSADNSFFAALGLRPHGFTDVTKSLKAQLEELEDVRSVEPGAGAGGNSATGSTNAEGQSATGTGVPAKQNASSSPVASSGLVSESPEPTKRTRNGSPREETPQPPQDLGQRGLPNGDMSVVKQLDSTPRGDKPEAVIKAEGFTDASEDPLKS